MSNHYYVKRRLLDKKVILIAVAALIAIVAIVLIAILCTPKKKENANKTVYDTTLLGNGEIDPQNAELTEEEGADVQAGQWTKEEGRSHGIDVSKWQGKIDWKMVKEAGIEFAFIRIGYRGEDGTIYKDDNADYNIQQAQKNGILVGVYFFSTAISEKEAKEEASWTIQAIEGYRISYPVVYDCEGYKSLDSRMFLQEAEQRTNNALAFLKTITDAGYEAMFYGARNEIENLFYWEVSRIQETYKVWVAYYPQVTYPEVDEPDYNQRFDAWQYTNKGSVSGISGNVDMVVCYFTRDEVAAKNEAAIPGDAKAPLTDEEKMYTTVNEQVTAKETVNLRQSTSTNSDIVKVLKNGETVTRVGIGTNGWSKLSYNGQIVYAITSYLTTDVTAVNKNDTSEQTDVVAGNTFEAKKDRVTAKEYVNLRTLPTTDSDIVGTLHSGEFLERTAVSNKGWSRLSYKGQTVYAVTSYLSNEVVEPTEPSTPTVQPESDGYVTVDEMVTAKEVTNLRTAPTTEGSEIVYTLPNGEYVRRIGIHSNGWSKLEYNGQIVYAITSYLTE